MGVVRRLASPPGVVTLGEMEERFTRALHVLRSIHSLAQKKSPRRLLFVGGSLDKAGSDLLSR
jgi:hypothetical protein